MINIKNRADTMSARNYKDIIMTDTPKTKLGKDIAIGDRFYSPVGIARLRERLPLPATHCVVATDNGDKYDVKIADDETYHMALVQDREVEDLKLFQVNMTLVANEQLDSVYVVIAPSFAKAVAIVNAFRAKYRMDYSPDDYKFGSAWAFPLDDELNPRVVGKLEV